MKMTWRDWKTCCSAFPRQQDPNAVSTRSYFVSWINTPIKYAIQRHNLKAVKLLVEHGAKVTPDLFAEIGLQDIEICKFLTDSGRADNINFGEYPYNVFRLATLVPLLSSQKDVDIVSSCIAFVLKHGGLPNELNVHGLSGRKTALDILQQPELNKFDISALIKNLKAHGALTYDELVKIRPEMPHLEITGDVHPMFKQVVSAIEKSEPWNCVISTKYDGLDCPVLVIDHGRQSSDNGQPYYIRKEVVAHRRETPTAWRQEGEKFDVPAGERVVLTPVGTKLPSRLVGGMPRACIIHEEWYSFPDFEVYFEQPIDFLNAPSSREDIPWIREIAGDNPEIWEAWRQQSQKYKCNLGNDNEHRALLDIFKTHYVINFTWSDKQRVLMKKAGEQLRKNGINANWLPVNDSDSEINYYAFSTRRTANEIPSSNLMDFVPYPDEIIVYIKHELKRKDRYPDIHHSFPNSKIGLTYWNTQYHYVAYGSKNHPFAMTICYGDEVPEETLSKILDILSKIL